MRFSEESKIFLQNLEETDRVGQLKPVIVSSSRIDPGDVLIFRYFLGTGAGSRKQRIVLVVKTRRGNGFFPGKKGVILMSCFKLTSKSEETISLIIENLYKKRRRSSYYGKIKEALEKLLGKGSFRTYKITKIKESAKIEIDI